jgi:hypothetical protein
LQQAVAALSTSTAPPTSLLEQALENATTIQDQLQSDVANLQPDQAKVSSLVAQQTKQTDAEETNPYSGASTAAQRLVQRYLALQDAQNASSSPDSYLTTLFGNTGQSVVNINLTGLDLTT